MIFIGFYYLSTISINIKKYGFLQNHNPQVPCSNQGCATNFPHLICHSTKSAPVGVCMASVSCPLSLGINPYGSLRKELKVLRLSILGMYTTWLFTKKNLVNAVAD